MVAMTDVMMLMGWVETQLAVKGKGRRQKLCPVALAQAAATQW